MAIVSLLWICTFWTSKTVYLAQICMKIDFEVNFLVSGFMLILRARIAHHIFHNIGFKTFSYDGGKPTRFGPYSRKDMKLHAALVICNDQLRWYLARMQPSNSVQSISNGESFNDKPSWFRIQNTTFLPFR